MSVELIKTFIEYHIDMTHRVWDSIDQITDEQFLADDAYSRGSIRNLMVHLVSTDRRWLAGLKNQPDAGHLKFEDYPTRTAARESFENVAKDLAEYVEALSEDELNHNANDLPNPRWKMWKKTNMKPNEIITIFDYSFWAFERVWDCTSQISEEQFVEEIDYSTGSIRNIVVHMMSASTRWVSRLQGKETRSHLAFEDYDFPSKIKAKWDELRKDFLDYANSLNQEELDEAVQWELLGPGLKSTNTRWEILLHVANHATDHRAQILAILHHHFHVKTVEQDMIIYLAERNQK